MRRRKKLRSIDAVVRRLVVTLGGLRHIETLVLALARLLRHVQLTGKFGYQLSICFMVEEGQNSDTSINAVVWCLVVTLGGLRNIETLVLALARLLRHVQRTGKFRYQLSTCFMVEENYGKP
jgi:hypothetical protein